MSTLERSERQLAGMLGNFLACGFGLVGFSSLIEAGTTTWYTIGTKFAIQGAIYGNNKDQVEALQATLHGQYQSIAVCGGIAVACTVLAAAAALGTPQLLAEHQPLAPAGAGSGDPLPEQLVPAYAA